MTSSPMPRLRRLSRDERGVASVFNLFMTLTCCTIGAVAVDVTQLYDARSHLQISADLGAHAALYARRYGAHEDRGSGSFHYPLSNAAAETAAIAAMQFGVPEAHGTIVTTDDILIGRYDQATGRVYHDPDEPDAAEAAAVLTHRSGGSSVGTFLFRLVGIRDVDVSTAAVFALGPGNCDSDEGLFSQQEIQIQSGNTFYPGFCIGAPEFQLQNGNEFRLGVTTTIPTRSDLDLPNSDVDVHNPGLMHSLDFGSIDLSSVINLINKDDEPATIPSQYWDHQYAYSLLAPGAWTTNVGVARDATPVTRQVSSATNFAPADLAQNQVHVINCTSTNESRRKISLRSSGSNVFYRNMVILTNCSVDLDGGIHLQNVVVSSSFESSNRASVSIPSSNTGPTIGTDDDCAAGGGAALITRGSFDAAAKPRFFGAVIRAAGEVDFQSGSVAEGVSVMAASLVDTNSGHQMAACGPAAGALPRTLSLRMMR